MSVRRAQKEIDSREFAEWMAFGRIEPWGEERDDIRSAMLLQFLFNSFRGEKQKAAKLEDFLMRFDADGPRKKQTGVEMQNILKQFTAVHNRKHGNDKHISGSADSPDGAVP